VAIPGLGPDDSNSPNHRHEYAFLRWENNRQRLCKRHARLCVTGEDFQMNQQLRTPATLPAAMALKQFGAVALNEPEVRNEVARFVSQAGTRSNRLRLTPAAGLADFNKAAALIASEMLLACADFKNFRLR